MQRKIRHAIHDTLEAIARVEEITDGKTLLEFEESWAASMVGSASD